MKYDDDGYYDFTVNDLIEKLKELQELGYGSAKICLNYRYGIDSIHTYNKYGKYVDFTETSERYF